MTGAPSVAFQPRSLQISQNAHWQELWSDPQNDGEIMGGAAARPALEAIWRSFLEIAALSSGDLVLDVAAGAAPIARIADTLPANARPAFVCIDYAPAALNSARRTLGARVVCCVGDAKRLPFAAGSFAAVVSQFGLEYAGREAFPAAAAQLRPGASLCAIVHAAGGAIAIESVASEKAVCTALDEGLIRRTRETLNASYEAAGAYLNKKKETAFRRALDEVRSLAGASPPSAGRNVVMRYRDDIERLAARRFAFAPDDALGWLKAVEGRLKSYAARMKAMQAAAQSQEDMAAVASIFAASGLVDIAVEAVQFRAGDAQGAWRLSARRPS